MDENHIRQIVREEIARYFGSRLILKSHVQLLDGRNIQAGKTTGTKIGTESTQKLGFFGADPIDRPAAPTDTASIISTLQSLGLTA